MFEPPRRSVDVVVAAVGAHRPGFVARVMLGDATHSSPPRRMVWVDVRDVARDAVWHSDELPLSREAFEALAAAATREAAKLGADDAAAVDAFLREFPDRETWPNGRGAREARTLRQYWEVFPGLGAVFVPGPCEIPPPYPTVMPRAALYPAFNLARREPRGWRRGPGAVEPPRPGVRAPWCRAVEPRRCPLAIVATGQEFAEGLPAITRCVLEHGHDGECSS